MLEALHNIDKPDDELQALDDFVNPKVMQPAYAYAQEIAKMQVEAEDFPTAFRLDRFTVAVTGHRPNRLVAGQHDRIMRQLDAVLAGFEKERQPERLVLLDGLAEGADRMAAHAALGRGWALAAHLPFSHRRYLEDFGEAASRAEFERLLARAERVVANGAADGYADRDEAYVELGQALIAGADALIAIWDGAPAQGKGGTVEVIEAARAKGIPVVWIHAREDVVPRAM